MKFIFYTLLSVLCIGATGIAKADVTLTSITVASASANQGSTNNVVNITKMDVATSPVTVNSMQFTLAGTHDANDLTIVRIYFNATSPTVSGASNLANVVGTFGAPHLYSIGISQSIGVGGSGYFIVAVDINATATDNNTVFINTATNPVAFGFSTAPNVTNNQTNIGGILTIDAADITLATTAVAAAEFSPGATAHVVYIASMNVATEPVLVNNIQFSLGGTHDANDLTIVRIYFNATNPTIAGASNLANVVGTFGAPHLYSIGISQAIAVGNSGYFIIAVDASPTATIGNTVQINGAIDPVVFGFTTAPNITNNQTDLGGIQVIPVSFIYARANRQGNTILVTWRVGFEINMNNYIVERSIDGSHFNGQATIAARGSGTETSYDWIDAFPLTGTNFYRIKAVSQDGRIQYSQVLRIDQKGDQPSISMYPNPVIKGNPVNLQLQQIPAGNYTLTIYNQSGQAILSKQLSHTGNNTVETLSVGNLIVGNYYLQLKSSDMIIVRKFMIVPE